MPPSMFSVLSSSPPGFINSLQKHGSEMRGAAGMIYFDVLLIVRFLFRSGAIFALRITVQCRSLICAATCTSQTTLHDLKMSKLNFSPILKLDELLS